jgi:hypothetical protein
LAGSGFIEDLWQALPTLGLGCTHRQTKQKPFQCAEDTIMKPLVSVLCFLCAVIYAGSVWAAEQEAMAIEGTYLLRQDDNYLRVLSFDRGGNVAQTSDQQTLIGFTEGLGAWKEIGPDKFQARVIDFSFNPKSGKRIGPSLIIYDLSFTDLESGHYQKVSGSYSGKVFPAGENPIAPKKPAIQSFGIRFKGERVSL